VQLTAAQLVMLVQAAQLRSVVLVPASAAY
jgi:hypothetical protein